MSEPIARSPDAPRCLSRPCGVIADMAGALWVADSGNHRVIGMDPQGRITAVIGRGEPGRDDGAWSRARFDRPRAMALTGAGDALYVVDATEQVRRVDLAARAVATIAHLGDGLVPSGVALDDEAGVLYLAIAGAHQIRQIRLSTGACGPLAGTGTPGADDGACADATFSEPRGLALSPDRRRLYVADAGNRAIRVIELASATVTTLVGPGSAPAGQVAPPSGRVPAAAPDPYWTAIAITPSGLVVTDARGHALCGVNPRHGTVMTIWRGAGAHALSEPGCVAFERPTRTYLIADTAHHRLLRIARDMSGASEVIPRGLV